MPPHRVSPKSSSTRTGPAAPRIDWLDPDADRARAPLAKANRDARIPYSLSMQQFADHIGSSRKTVGRWIKSGKLRAIRINKMVRILEEDAIAFLATHRR